MCEDEVFGFKVPGEMLDIFPHHDIFALCEDVERVCSDDGEGNRVERKEC